MDKIANREKVFCRNCIHTSEYTSTCKAFFTIDYSQEDPQSCELKKDLNGEGNCDAYQPMSALKRFWKEYNEFEM